MDLAAIMVADAERFTARHRGALEVIDWGPIPLIQAGVARAVLPDPDHASLDRFGLTVRRIDPEPQPMRA